MLFYTYSKHKKLKVLFNSILTIKNIENILYDLVLHRWQMRRRKLHPVTKDRD